MIKQLLKGEIISIDYVKSKMNLANSLNKSLGRKMISETLRGKGANTGMRNQK